jgi:hypothetical protein
MVLAIALTIALVAVYCKYKLTEEVESLAASIVVCLCLFLSLVFAPLLLKFFLLIVLLIYQKAIPTKSVNSEL